MTAENVAETVWSLFWLWFLYLALASGWRLLRQSLSNVRRGRRIDDFLFEPADAGSLPERTAEHFHRCTSAYEELGFRRLGDFRLRRHPQGAWSRFLLSDDGRTIGEIVDWYGLRTWSFFSICDDGVYLETSATGHALESPVSRLLQVHHHAEASIDSLHRRHLEHVSDHQRQQGCSAVVLTARQLDDAANYGRRLLRARRPLVRLFAGGRVERPDFIALRHASANT